VAFRIGHCIPIGHSARQTAMPRLPGVQQRRCHRGARRRCLWLVHHAQKAVRTHRDQLCMVVQRARHSEFCPMQSNCVCGWAQLGTVQQRCDSPQVVPGSGYCKLCAVPRSSCPMWSSDTTCASLDGGSASLGSGWGVPEIACNHSCKSTPLPHVSCDEQKSPLPRAPCPMVVFLWIRRSSANAS
jgi:hypothetical protein